MFAQWYGYADGYLTSPGFGRIAGEARDVLRLAAVTRSFPLEVLSTKEAKEAPARSAAARGAL